MKHKVINTCCDPMKCDHCQYIGEGDFICDKCDYTLVVADFVPTSDYMICMNKSHMPRRNVSSLE